MVDYLKWYDERGRGVWTQIKYTLCVNNFLPFLLFTWNRLSLTWVMLLFYSVLDV